MKANIFVAMSLIGSVVAQVDAADWIVAPSYYSHDPMTGQRVTQYSPIGPFYNYARRDYLRSGYRHTRSSIQAGNSVDHMHIVEEYGRTIRPYGEWRFPYRPYSVPYQLWGPPFAGLGVPGWGPRGVPPTPDALPGRGRRGATEPWNDGNYPRDRVRPRLPYRPNYRMPPHYPGPPPSPSPGPGPGPGPGPRPHGGGSA